MDEGWHALRRHAVGVRCAAVVLQAPSLQVRPRLVRHCAYPCGVPHACIGEFSVKFVLLCLLATLAAWCMHVYVYRDMCAWLCLLATLPACCMHVYWCLWPSVHGYVSLRPLRHVACMCMCTGVSGHVCMAISPCAQIMWRQSHVHRSGNRAVFREAARTNR